jgi:hypothetical protein
MRFTQALLFLGCATCCPLAMQDELVPITVRVDHGAVAYARAPSVDAPVTSSVDPCDMPPPDISSCVPIAYVRASQVMTDDERCYLDAKVHAAEVGRVMQCGGGSAMVVFDDAAFVGVSSNGYINVCKTTTYELPHTDNCTWRTEQRIQGTPSNLGYSYTESPVAGRACTLSCRARATLQAP